jgi:hypothetical protein
MRRDFAAERHLLLRLYEGADCCLERFVQPLRYFATGQQITPKHSHRNVDRSEKGLSDR